ncbi:MAG: hypothetical protein ACKO3F_14255 [Cyanobium sp.]
MGFRYLDKIATPEHVQQFLELADLALGAGQSAENVSCSPIGCATPGRCSTAASAWPAMPIARP